MPARPVPLPQRDSLAHQTATIVREQIANGRWTGILPGERRLCSLLQVSRNTVRSALAQLRKAGLIEPDRGIGNRIVASAAKQSPPRRDVAFLSPVPLEELQPRQTLWLDDLRGMLGERGYRLHVFHGPRYFRKNPDAVLRALVDAEPHGCWILSTANDSVQRWFCVNRVPCVVAGSAHANLDLPFSDLDHRAICRHAVGVFLRLGHERMAFFTFKSRQAGELESIEGFKEGIRQALGPDAPPRIIQHDGTVAGIHQRLHSLLETKPRPTALLVASASYYLAVCTRLAQVGIRIPADVSLMSRDDSSFLRLVAPSPARYVANPNMMAKNLLRPVLQILKGGVGSAQGRFIMPDFVRGDSIGPSSKRSE